ncbi:MAG: GNAT family N-acetyltransferase [Burkholderiales bacterium]
MNVTLVRAGSKDAETILEGQRNAFLPMLERYNDGDMDPANEKLENIQKAIRGQHFYKILADGKFAGALLIEEERGGERLKLHTLYVLPELQNMGIGGRAIDIAERLHQGAADWTLNCPADLENNRHLYEKKGYIKRSEQKINDALTIVNYTKCGDAAAVYEAIAAREAKRDGVIELAKGESVSVARRILSGKAGTAGIIARRRSNPDGCTKACWICAAARALRKSITHRRSSI